MQMTHLSNSLLHIIISLAKALDTALDGNSPRNEMTAVTEDMDSSDTPSEESVPIDKEILQVGAILTRELQAWVLSLMHLHCIEFY